MTDNGMHMKETVFTAYPKPLFWKNKPVNFREIGPAEFAITAAPNTDWFIDPADENWNKDCAPCALFLPPDPEFLFSAKIKVPFASTFDAGTIQIRAEETIWGKLCFEFSPQGRPTVVSVVTRGKSDDCNGPSVDANEVYLRVAVTPASIAFHYSTDGNYWNMARFFTLGNHANLQVGLSAQSPCGTGCEVIFSDIHYRAGRLQDHRNGE